MVKEVPDVPRKAKFSIKETASILGISRTSLYRYIKEKYIFAKVRPCNGRQYFTGAEIIRFWGVELIN